MKDRVIRLLHRTGALECARRLQRHRSVVLTYHGVVTASSKDLAYLDDNFPDAGVFERQIEYIAHRYRPIRLSDLVAHYEHRQAPPPGSIAVTFDDGFANNCTVALPILQKYQVPFTVFLTTGLIGDSTAQLWTERAARAMCLSTRHAIDIRLPNGQSFRASLDGRDAREHAARALKDVLKRMRPVERNAALRSVEDQHGRPELLPEESERYSFLTWAQVRMMANTGVEFGSHTVTHPILSTLSDPQVATELADSKKRIEAETNRECFAFAYPNGSAADFRASDKTALREAGYRCAFTNEGGPHGMGDDLFALTRINIVRRFDRTQFEAALTGVLNASSQVRAAADRLTRFVRPDLRVPLNAISR